MSFQIFPEKVNYLTVDSDVAGQRVDNFLMRVCKGVPRSHIYNKLRKGEVRVNKKRIKQTYRLETGDILRIPPIHFDSKVVNKAPRMKIDALLANSLYEDDELLIINKPSGLAVHSGSGVKFGLIEVLREHHPEYHRSELVHRLDRATSGCLMLAKKRSVLRYYHEQLQLGTVRKRYLALVEGQCSSKRFSVNQPLLKSVPKSGERMVMVDKMGKPSLTEYRVVRKYASASLVEVELMTGRTHQIRVHSAFTGHPVAGDQKYGSKMFNQEMKKVGLNRLFLHAENLNLSLPNGQKLAITAPLDAGLNKVLERL